MDCVCSMRSPSVFSFFDWQLTHKVAALAEKKTAAKVVCSRLIVSKPASLHSPRELAPMTRPLNLEPGGGLWKQAQSSLMTKRDEKQLVSFLAQGPFLFSSSPLVL